MFIQRGYNNFEIKIEDAPSFLNTYSLDFDGIDDYVGVSLTPSSSDVSVSFWIKAPIQGLGNVFGGSGIFQYFGGTSSANLVTNHWTVGWATICTDVFDDQWHHIVVTFNNATSDLISYKDGVLNTTVNIPGFSTVTNHGINRIGTYGGAPQRYFEGIQDDISLFNSVLTQSDVTSIYNGGTPNDLSLLATPPNNWYRMGDNGSYKSPQWLMPSNENKDKVSSYSFEFDGVGDYISVSNNSIGQTQNISYSIWVNLDVTTRQYIIGNQSSSDGGCGLAVESGDVLVFQMADGGNDSFFNNRVANFSTYAPINTWNHILATWDGTDSKIYINGVLRNTWNPTLPYTISNYSTFWIARRSANLLNTVNGKLDEIALFDSGVSIGDVWDGSGQPIDVSSVSGITNNWRMGEEATFSGGVWTVPDAVGSNDGSNDGTSNAMTIEDRIGEAPNSSNNALSFNMDEVDRVTDVPT